MNSSSPTFVKCSAGSAYLVVYIQPRKQVREIMPITRVKMSETIDHTRSGIDDLYLKPYQLDYEVRMIRPRYV